ncbi:MAG: class I SAM-dependent methyltransferase [Vicinamibacterales bacterium]
MPTLKENAKIWQELYDWSRAGDEWSEAWGGEDAQWYGVILPRIQAFVTDAQGIARAQTILEIAPGFGRWTKYLKGYCHRLMLVDLAPKCIEACRTRFAADGHIEYHVNDGKSLAQIPDDAIDFLFSMDSLVHVEEDVIEAYLAQAAAKLTRTGIGFIHHSNLGAVKDRTGTPDHNRAGTMTADFFKRVAEQNGLRCLSQELINWGGRGLIDSLSVFTRADSAITAPYVRLENPAFMDEATFCRRRAALYGKHRLGR